MPTLDDQTIDDFDEQLTRYGEIDGWFASIELFRDTIEPLLSPEELEGKDVVDIGSGVGRIVSQILKSGAAHVTAVEPTTGGFETLQRNVKATDNGDRVEFINARGHEWHIAEPADYVVSIGVIPFIEDPDPVVTRSYEMLKPGGRIFFWLYSYEGNEMYLSLIEPLRKLTPKLPHILLRAIVEMLYWSLCLYRLVTRIVPLPLKKYIDTVLWPMTPDVRRLVIYDQLNPTYAKYHRKQEAIELLEKGGFKDVQVHHRHGYSWGVIGTK